MGPGWFVELPYQPRSGEGQYIFYCGGSATYLASTRYPLNDGCELVIDFRHGP
jgi:hypothetical protein